MRDEPPLSPEPGPRRAARVVGQGPCYARSRGTRPRLRVAAKQGVDRLLSELTRMGLHADAEDGAVLVSTADPQADGADLLRRLLLADIDVYECAPVEPEARDIVLDAYQ